MLCPRGQTGTLLLALCLCSFSSSPTALSTTRHETQEVKSAPLPPCGCPALSAGKLCQHLNGHEHKVVVSERDARLFNIVWCTDCPRWVPRRGRHNHRRWHLRTSVPEASSNQLPASDGKERRTFAQVLDDLGLDWSNIPPEAIFKHGPMFRYIPRSSWGIVRSSLASFFSAYTSARDPMARQIAGLKLLFCLRFILAAKTRPSAPLCRSPCRD